MIYVVWLVTAVFVAASLFWNPCFRVLKRSYRIRQFEGKVGGPPKVPLLGNLLDLNKGFAELSHMFLFEWPKEHGPRYTFSYGTNHFFASLKPDDLEKILSSSVHIKKGKDYDFVRSWLGDGLVMSSGAKWAHRRKILTPSFHFKILEDFIPIFNTHSKTFVRIIQEKAAKNEYFDVCRPITLCTLDIICETAMGRHMNTQKNPVSPYVEAILGMGELVFHRYLKPWLHPNVTWKYSELGRKEKEYLEILHGYTRQVLREKKDKVLESRLVNNIATEADETTSGIYMGKRKRALAFLDQLLEFQREHPNILSDADILEETDVFMFEGHDTTATNLEWTLLCIGNSPECQEKIFEELDTIFGNDKEKNVNSEDLAKMKYLECCIKESLRMYPSVPYIARDLKEDLVLGDGLIVPEGMVVTMFMLPIHRNPEIYTEPDVFKPERFFIENSNGRHAYAYVPFSAGPRNCIGQKFALIEEKIILSNLFRNFSCHALQKLGEVAPMTQLVLRPNGGIKLKFTKR